MAAESEAVMAVVYDRRNRDVFCTTCMRMFQKKMLFNLSCSDLSKKRTGPPFVRPMSKRKRDGVSQIVEELAQVYPYSLQAAKQLYEMIQSGDANVQQLQTNSKLINRLVAMLRMEEDKCRIAAANVLSLLATNEYTHPLMADARVCEPLVQMLRSEDDQCKYAAITVIVCMSATKGIDQSLVDALVDAGVIEPCIKMIKSDHRDIAVRVVSHLTAIPGQQYRIAEAGAITSLGKLVCEDHHSIATLALLNLSPCNALKPQIANTGVIRHLVAMIREKGDENAVGLLSNLSFSAELRVQIVNCEAIEPLVAMLSSDNIECRWPGSIALLNLAIWANEWSQRIVNAGAIPPVVAALASDDYRCKLYASMLIRSLMEDDESGDIRLQTVNAGACPALVSLLRTGDHQTKAEAARALCRLSQCDKVVKHMLIVDGLFYVLDGCLAKYALRISERCFRTLYNIHTKTQMSKCTHLTHGTLLVLRSLPRNPYVLDYLSLILLTDDMLSQAMCLLHSFVSTHEHTACLICIGILMSCYSDESVPITLKSLTQAHVRRVLQPVLERALGNGELAVSHGRGSMCMQAAIAMERILTVSNISVKLNTFVVHPPTSTATWPDLSNMLKDDSLLAHADVTITLEDGELHGHKVILSDRCEYFKTMFAAPMLEQRTNEVRVKDCRLSVFRIMLYFLYSGKTTDGMLTPDTAQEVLVVADRYQVLPLVATVETYLSQQLDVSNALLMWTWAGSKELFELKTASMNYMLCHLSSIVAEFEKVPVKDRQKDGLSGPAFRKTVVDAYFETVSKYV